MNKKDGLVLIVVCVTVVLGFASSILDGWDYVFDDAFITYRYSKNLAFGYGITWNRGLAPTEGYTNFLLVIFLAPFIKFGFDPLLITRIVSYFSAFAMAGILFVVIKSRSSCSTAIACLISSLILMAPQTHYLCLVGLETVVYALFLLMVFHISVEFLFFGRARTSVYLGILIVFTMLLRPEALFLYLVMCVVYCITIQARPFLGIRPLIVGLVVAVAIGLVYLTWKTVHFGQLLPNPFYVKATGDSFISAIGVQSVFSFAQTYFLFLLILCGSVLYNLLTGAQRRYPSNILALFGLSVILIYAIFFMHIDTLMDFYGRFMFPLLPILIYSNIPVLVAVLTFLEKWTAKRVDLFILFIIGFILILSPTDFFRIYDNTRHLFSTTKSNNNNSLMEQELRVALSLSRFPTIENVRIAFGDSGLIPYYTDSIWLDVVGLNDGVIARTKDKRKLVDYFFSFQPDLVIHPGQKNFSWTSYGHGPLGDYASWSRDPRWNSYVYVGTCKTSGQIYDLQFFVRKSSRFQKPLTKYLREKVVDGYYDPFPYSLGTYTPDKENQPTWVLYP